MSLPECRTQEGRAPPPRLILIVCAIAGERTSEGVYKQTKGNVMEITQTYGADRGIVQREMNKSYITKGLFNLACGRKIGEGAFREVFEYKLDPACVLKADLSDRFQNIAEWQVWDQVQHTVYAKWFAPCLAISDCGVWLVQKKTAPIKEKNLPTHVPAFFTDIKQDNIGRYKGHPCFHDYGLNLLITEGLSKKVKKVKNW